MLILKNLSEICGRADAISNTNMVPLAVSNLTPVHDTSEERLQKKNEQSIHLIMLQETKNSINKNEACSEASNCMIPTSGQLLDGMNNFHKQNGFVSLNEKVNAKQEFSENDPNNLPLPEALLSNGMLKLACSEVHVHDDPINSSLLKHIDSNDIENESNINGIGKMSSLEMSNDSKLHEMGDVVEPIVLLLDSNHCHSDMSSILPPIDESVEYCSTSSKSLENMQGEHNYIYMSFCVCFMSYLNMFMEIYYCRNRN